MREKNEVNVTNIFFFCSSSSSFPNAVRNREKQRGSRRKNIDCSSENRIVFAGKFSPHSFFLPFLCRCRSPTAEFLSFAQISSSILRQQDSPILLPLLSVQILFPLLSLTSIPPFLQLFSPFARLNQERQQHQRRRKDLSEQ